MGAGRVVVAGTAGGERSKMAGRMINGAAALAELVRPASEADDFGAHRMVPVLPELSGLLPGRGLRRGSTVAVAVAGERAATAGGGTSLLLALLAGASRAGSWCAVVGVPTLGVLAAAESGIALDRLALVPNPGPEWPTVVAALIDGVDVVVVAAPGPVSASIVGRLAARARQRGCVLVPYGRWDGADVTLQVVRGMWDGLGIGHGRLRRREVTIAARGRGAAARPRELTMWMPGITTTSLPDVGATGSAQPASGQPALGQRALGQWALGQPASGQPALGQPASGQPAWGRPTSIYPASSQPASIQPARPTAGRPSYPPLAVVPSRADEDRGPADSVAGRRVEPAGSRAKPADSGSRAKPADSGSRAKPADSGLAVEPADSGVAGNPAGRAGGRPGKRPRRPRGALYPVGPA